MMPSGLKTSGRVLLAVAGGYFASSALLAMFCILLVALGMPRAEAVTLGLMLAFVFYLCLILWVFSARVLWRPLLVFSLLIVCGYGITVFIGHGG